MSKKTGFSLSAFDTVARCEKGDTLHLLHPDTGDAVYNGETPLTISMYGKDSNISLDLIQEAVRREVKAKRVRKGKNKEELFDIRESIEEVSEKNAKLVFEWTGFEDEDGKALECTFDNVKSVLIKFKEIRQQVSDFFENADGLNFIKG